MKSLFEEIGGTYTWQGDYYLPNLSPPAEENKPIGIQGQRHWQYIRQHKRIFYTNLMISGKLNGYLADVDKQAEEMFFRLVKQRTEKLKVEHPMEWVGKMNSLREAATEIVNTEMIFA